MSYQVGDVCYPTAHMAAAASASREAGALVVHGDSTYAVSVQAVSDTSISYVLTPPAGGAAIALQTPYIAQECGLMGAADGMWIGWAIGGAWICAYALLFLAKALRGEHDDGRDT